MQFKSFFRNLGRFSYIFFLGTITYFSLLVYSQTSKSIIFILPILLVFCTLFPNLIAFFTSLGVSNQEKMANKFLTPQNPQFILENIYPWEAAYVYFHGKPDTGDLVLSYLFWLVEKKYISIKNISGTIIITNIQQNIPHYFSAQIHKELDMSDTRFSLLFDRINQKSDLLLSEIKLNLSSLYIIKPGHLFGYFVLVGMFFGVFCWIFFIVFTTSVIQIAGFQHKLVARISNWLTYIPVIIISLSFLFHKTVTQIIDANYLMTSEGKIIRNKLLAYNLYLQKVEQPKLNFENNIQRKEFQTYISHLSYCVAFGYIIDLSLYADSMTKDK